MSKYIIPLVLLIGCGYPEGEIPKQTKILRVEVNPNPAFVGDTVQFKCVIQDSSNSGFIFIWFTSGDDRLKPDTTETEIYEWVAPSELGSYDHVVTVDNGSKHASKVNTTFIVDVIKN